MSAEQQQRYIAAGVTYVTAFFPKDMYCAGYKELHGDLKIDPIVQNRFESMALSLVDELLDPSRINQLVDENPAIVAKLFQQFKSIATGEIAPAYDQSIDDEIGKAVPTPGGAQILKMFCTFNHALLMTNMFKSGPMQGVTFRLNPAVVLHNRPRTQYPETPYGIYLVQGAQFAGFHTRMRDVARGGLRMILSRSDDIREKNARTLFDEGYNLALTQQRKNKDIPEGGSKGVILPFVGVDPKPVFVQFIEAMLDCMQPKEYGIYDGNMKNRAENLYFGPDENTADYMDMAAEIAKSRGYAQWKAITTGKSVKLGGIPHDVHGMTTASVHTCVVELLKVLNLDESKITKCQTGGPDGDLGSNEILMSLDKTLAIVDGSGVLFDPAGLHRPELVRLAEKRATVKEFNRQHLGAGAFLHTIDEKDIVLPDGSKWASGERLRNVAHELDFFRADLFVPCGGRPKAVTIENVNKMFDKATGKPKFNMIVEGANLFFTDAARAVLEKGGCHVFKDATTNKGGVTSSSLEVFSGLALNDDDHSRMMTYDPANAKPSEFYDTYVKQILEVIRENARLEFHAIWKQFSETNMPKVEATRQLSLEITEMQDVMCENVSSMSQKERLDLLFNVLPRALPRVMVDHLSVQGIVKNVPENYLWAVVGAWIGSRYVYNHGIGASKVSFFFFMRELMGRSRMQLAVGQLKTKLTYIPPTPMNREAGGFGPAKKVAIIGCGNWGSVAARIAAQNALRHADFDADIRMWVYEEEFQGSKLSHLINTNHINPKYLPGVFLGENVRAVPDLVEAVAGATLLVFVTPHQHVKGICAQIKGKLTPGTEAISLVKGMDVGDAGFGLISKLIQSELGIRVAVLMGANVANEIAQESFSEATVGHAPGGEASGELWKRLFSTNYFQVHCVPDIVGCELCGTLKNIVALGAGFVDGMDLGNNTKAAIMRIGLVEMRKISQHFFQSVKTDTFFESAGVADLITTCFGGRNVKCAEMFVRSTRSGLPKTWEQLEIEHLGGQKLDGVLTSNEVQAVIQRANMEDTFPLFTTINLIANRTLGPETIVKFTNENGEPLSPMSPMSPNTGGGGRQFRNFG